MKIKIAHQSERVIYLVGRGVFDKDHYQAKKEAEEKVKGIPVTEGYSSAEIQRQRELFGKP